MDNSILDAVGSPLVCVDSSEGPTVMAKMESKNPGGSARNRSALAMVEVAGEMGDISPGDRLVEPMSRNTGIELAVVAATRDYDLAIAMPDSMSPERREIIRAYGAAVELVDGDISVARDRAGSLEAEGMHQLRQFENPTNPKAYYRTTAEEVLERVGDRRIDALVVGIGTDDTISGTGSHLIEEFLSMRVVGVESAESVVLSDREVGNDDFQEIDPGLVSPNLNTNLLDDVEIVEPADAEAEYHRLACGEGIFVGQLSGASLLAAKCTAEWLAASGADEEDQPLVVAVFWDSGERYVSTKMFDAEE